MNLLTFKDINIDDWQDLIRKSCFASPFQTYEFYQFINNLKNLKAEVYAVSCNGILQGLMVVVIFKEKGLKSYFSRRGIVYGGPLLLENNQEVLIYLLNKSAELLWKRIIYLEVRNFFDYSAYKPAYIEQGYNYIPYLNYIIHTSGKNIDNVLKLMTNNRRRQIKLSISNGATYECTNSVIDIYQLYSILKDLYDKKIKLPLPELRFFLSFANTNIAKVFVVKLNNQVVGGSFCFILPKKGIYTMYTCGLNINFKRIYPNVLAVFSTIEYAIKNGYQYVDLMGAGRPGVPYGVRDFKAEFGGELVEYGRLLKIFKPFLYKLGKFALNYLYR